MATENHKERPISKKLRKRATQAVKGLLEGKTQSEIAEDMNLCRQTVNRLLSTKEVEEILKRSEDKAIRLMDKAMEKLEKVLDEGDHANTLKAALAILRSKGVVKEQMDLNHNIPIPTVVSYGDRKIVMGAKLPGKEGGESEN